MVDAARCSTDNLNDLKDREPDHQWEVDSSFRNWQSAIKWAPRRGSLGQRNWSWKPGTWACLRVDQWMADGSWVDLKAVGWSER